MSSNVIKKCLVNNCLSKYYENGYCQKHYLRLWRHGDVNFSKREFHGQLPKYLYQTWTAIKSRTTNKKTPSYKYYGGRGISFYKPWLTSFISFRDYILTNLGERPNDYSLDRINNDRNYEPENLRWATQSEQCANQSLKKRNTSGFRGVSWKEGSMKWVARICYQNKPIHIGCFYSKEEASIAYNQIAKKLRNNNFKNKCLPSQ